jgi:hypothetical protein
MSRTSEAAEHGLRKGGRVIVLTVSYSTGARRRLYLYDTGASWAKAGLTNDKIAYSVTYEHWDGLEQVSFYNGD